MCGHDVRIEGDVVAAIVPGVVGSGEKVFDLEGEVVGDSEFFEIEVDPAGLLLRGDRDRLPTRMQLSPVDSICCRLRDVGDCLVAWKWREPSLWSAGLSRRIWLTLRDQRGEAVACAERSHFRISYFSLLRYSSLPVCWGRFSHELEGGPVDTVVRAKRCGEDEALLEGAAAAHLQVSWNVGRVGPEVGAKEIADRRLGELCEILCQLVLGVAPGEVGVGLGEAGLARGT